MILYADDDSDDLELFDSILSDLGRKVLTFNNGSGLLFQLKNPPPMAEFIFLDINMPIMSGFDVLTEIRSTQSWSHVPVAMLSSSGNPADLQKAKILGANYYVRKSHDLKKLIFALNLALSGAENLDDKLFDGFSAF